jgi:hypothetical protein
MKTKEAPGVGVVAHKSLGKAAIRAMQDALLAGMTVPGRGGDRFRSIDNSAYEYVATLGYFTPRTLAGTELVTAQQAQQLVARGVPLFDGRTEEEFRTGRPAGSRWLPYVERSTKETDYDDTTGSPAARQRSNRRSSTATRSVVPNLRALSNASSSCV